MFFFFKLKCAISPSTTTMTLPSKNHDLYNCETRMNHRDLPGYSWEYNPWQQKSPIPEAFQAPEMK